MQNELLIKNCTLYNSLTRGEPVDLLIQGGLITHIGKAEQEYKHVLNANGKIITPGFIDVHIQGAGGADILDGSFNALQTISKTLARYGTTGFLATTLFHTNENNKHLALAAEYSEKGLGGARILGLHLEGPFINPEKKGGISSAAIAPPSDALLAEILEITGRQLKIMTIAPELEGNSGIIRKLINYGVIASFGHSNATYEETKIGFDTGISHVTHLFNAMPPIHHRNPGPIPAIIETNHVSVQVIADGIHIHPVMLNFLSRNIAAERIICITDGIQAIGLPEGNYFYNGKEYQSKNGSARYPDGTLIGTALSLNQLVLRFKEFTGCSFETAINTISKNPATLLGLDDRKGYIDIGKDADLVILDDDYSVWATIIHGDIVYKKGNG